MTEVAEKRPRKERKENADRRRRQLLDAARRSILKNGLARTTLATVATAQLWNARLHVDWNQASIDSDRVCRLGEEAGEYVQWNPIELCYVNDWNVISVPDGKDLRQVLAAQELSKERLNDQPTAIVYRTIKGWKYGIEGRKSHGAGHGYCSDEYFATLQPAEERFGITFPRPSGSKDPVEPCQQ